MRMIFHHQSYRLSKSSGMVTVSKCSVRCTRVHYIRLAVLALLFFVFKATHAQTSETYTWNNVAIGGGGFVSGIITSKTQPGLVYARTDVGGAYRWDTVNSKWIPLVDWASESEQGIFGAESIALDPSNPANLYIAAGISYFNNGRSYILRSADYGATFSVTDVTSLFKINGNGMGRQNGEKLQVDPNNSSVLYCGSRSNGLFKSTDYGTSWSRLAGLNVTVTPNDNGLSFVVLDKSSTAGGVTKRIFAGISRSGNDQNFYKSEDAGATFTAVINPAIATGMMPQRAVLTSEGNLLIAYANGAGPYGTVAEPYDQGQIWKYAVAAGTWTNITPIGVNRAFGGINADPANPARIIISTINTYNLQYGNTYGDRFYLSTNGGSTWTDLVSRGFVLDANGMSWINGQSVHWAGSIEFDPFNSKKVWVTSGNGIFLNEDIDAAAGVWKFSVKGLEETVPRNMVSIIGGPLVSVISDYDGFTQPDPSQYALSRHQPAMGSTAGLDYAVSNKKVVRVGSSMYYSTDMGTTWTKTLALSGADGQVALSADGNTFLHCPNGSATMYRSVNNGASWAASTGISISNAKPVADGVNSSKFYVYNTGSGALMVSTDAGISFTTAAGSTNSGGSKIIRTVPGREGHIWIPLAANGLAYTEDAGATSFKKAAGVSSCAAVGIGKAAPGSSYETIYIWGTVSGISGLHRSTDKGLTWVRVNDDAHEYGGLANGQFVAGDMNIYGRVYMSTAGRGIAYGDARNEPPSALTLSTADVSQGNAIGALVAEISSADMNAGSTFTYSLVSGNGSENNAAFSISGSQLKAAIVFNAVTQASYNIRIRTTDNGGLSFEKAFVITVKPLFTLPLTNFSLQASDETCSNNNDGKISIAATQNLNYKATLTLNGVSKEYLFNTTLDIASLSAGTYALCITVAGQNDYRQCYDLNITEPKPLSVYATVNTAGKVLLNLGGALYYQVNLNGKIFSRTSGTLSLDLASGLNELSVTTDKECQGTFKKIFFLDEGKHIYPNPFDNTLFVNFGNDPSKTALLSLYTLSGKLVYGRELKIENTAAELNLGELQSGTYILKIKTEMGASTSKIVKK